MFFSFFSSILQKNSFLFSFVFLRHDSDVRLLCKEKERINLSCLENVHIFGGFWSLIIFFPSIYSILFRLNFDTTIDLIDISAVFILFFPFIYIFIESHTLLIYTHCFDFNRIERFSLEYVVLCVFHHRMVDVWSVGTYKSNIHQFFLL